MARIRSIHPDACDSRKLGLATADAERLFWRLQTHCDDHGRCEDDARLIWMRCCPQVSGFSETLVDRLLSELEGLGLLVRYRDGSKCVIEIVEWSTYQHPQRPGKSRFIAYSDVPPVPVRDMSDTPPGVVASGGEGSGEGEQPAGTLPDDDPVDNWPDFDPLDPPVHFVEDSRNPVTAIKDYIKGAKSGSAAL